MFFEAYENIERRQVIRDEIAAQVADSTRAARTAASVPAALARCHNCNCGAAAENHGNKKWCDGSDATLDQPPPPWRIPGGSEAWIKEQSVRMFFDSHGFSLETIGFLVTEADRVFLDAAPVVVAEYSCAKEYAALSARELMGPFKRARAQCIAFHSDGSDGFDPEKRLLEQRSFEKSFQNDLLVFQCACRKSDRFPLHRTHK